MAKNNKKIAGELLRLAGELVAGERTAGYKIPKGATGENFYWYVEDWASQMYSRYEAQDLMESIEDTKRKRVKDVAKAIEAWGVSKMEMGDLMDMYNEDFEEDED